MAGFESIDAGGCVVTVTRMREEGMLHSLLARCVSLAEEAVEEGRP